MAVAEQEKQFIIMKKSIFIFAVIAIACTACNGNGGNEAELPNQDQRALYAATTDVINQIGIADKATIDKSLTDAGFAKTENDANAIPPRLRAKAINAPKNEDEELVIYIYGIPKEYEHMSMDEIDLDELLKKGYGYDICAVTFRNNKLYMITTAVVTLANDTTNKMYAKHSAEMYETMPEGRGKQWKGSIYYGAEEVVMKDHAEYVATMASQEISSAMETCYSITEESSEGLVGVVYEGGMENGIEEFGHTLVAGSFNIADINVYMQ